MLSPFLYIARFILAELKIYSVSDEYIKYLRQDERLTIVFDKLIRKCHYRNIYVLYLYYW